MSITDALNEAAKDLNLGLGDYVRPPDLAKSIIIVIDAYKNGRVAPELRRALAAHLYHAGEQP